MNASDKDFLLNVLRDGREHSLQEILRRSFDERGHGLTVHSRAADLRRDGYNVEVAAGVRGGIYRLVGLDEAGGALPPDGGDVATVASPVSSSAAPAFQAEPVTPGSPPDSTAIEREAAPGAALQLSLEVVA